MQWRDEDILFMRIAHIRHYEDLINSDTGGSMASYEIGDTVRLTSGGAIMVIHGEREGEHFECVRHNSATPHSKIDSSKVLVVANHG